MRFRDLALALAVGIVAAVLRLGYVVFPLFNVVDAVLFGAAGYGVGRTRPGSRWASFILVVLPALAFVAFVLIVVGPTKPHEGVGVGHLYAVVVIPVAAGLGFWAAGRGETNAAAP